MTTQQHQTKTMETPINNMQQPAQQTMIVSLMPGAANLALKLIQHHRISYIDVGTDQTNARVVQVSYTSEQQQGVTDLITFLNFFESFVDAVKPYADALLQELETGLYLANLKYNHRKKISPAKTYLRLYPCVIRVYKGSLTCWEKK